MRNILTIMILGGLLMGCGGVQVKTVYQDVYIPIPYVPEPPEVTEPEYYSTTLTEEQRNDIGELSKAYVIDSKQALSYASNLKKVHDTYKILAENSENRIKAIEGLGGKVDHSLLEQASVEVQSELKALSVEIDTENEELDTNIEELRQMKKPD